MDPDNQRLRVSVSDGRGRPVRDGGLGRWLARVAPANARGEIAIALVSDAQIRTLNRTYRHADAPTDVLSFPWDDESRIRSPAPRQAQGAPIVSRGESRYLGDLVIALGVTRRQAREAGHSLQAELRVLALHGLLHLLGYDHEDPGDKGRMARAEARLRRKGGLSNGLIERQRASFGTAQTRSPRLERGAGGKSAAGRPPSEGARGCPPTPRLRRGLGVARRENSRAKAEGPTRVEKIARRS